MATAEQVAAAKAALPALDTAMAALQTQVNSVKALVNAIVVEPATLTVSAALGNGSTDATAGIQAAIDVCPAGGTVSIPAGTFMVNAVRGITLKTNMRLLMAAGTVLKVIPNGSTRYYVLKTNGASDVTIEGGQILGDRLTHNYAAAASSTHEWGYGIGLSGTRLKVKNTVIRECTGDGLSISGADIDLEGVECLYNRRQGASMFRVSGFKALNCKFNYTGDYNGNEGTAPQAGVDIEPDAGAANDIEFEGCEFIGNATSGFLAWCRSETSASVSNVRLVGCTIRDNANGLNAKALNGTVISVSVKGCTVGPNSGSGCRIEGGASFTIGGAGADANTFVSVAARADFDLTGRDSRTANDIRTLTGGVATVALNHYQ